ncbi:hypothetical protein K469DRAFT_469945, partial [Zopfia rhizophila CBS 207.26]
PYWSTAFARRNDISGYPLTHSQEKPYECPTCQTGFRHLHDLKRNTKLHTSKKSHICPKCGRKLARKGALDRH